MRAVLDAVVFTSMLIIVAFSVVDYRINGVMMRTVTPTIIFPPVLCKGAASNIQQNVMTQG